MHGGQGARDARRTREFKAFVAGAGGRLLHTATLLTAEQPDRNPRARRLLTASFAHTYAGWDGLHGEDPYAYVRQQLAVRFARSAWHQHRGRGHWYVHWYSRWYDLWDGLWDTWDARGFRYPGPHTPVDDAHTPDGGSPAARVCPGELLRRRAHPGGVLDALVPQERLVLVLRLYEGVAEEQTAALLGLPRERVGALCERAMSTLLHPPPEHTRAVPGGGSVALGSGRGTS